MHAPQYHYHVLPLRFVSPFIWRKKSILIIIMSVIMVCTRWNKSNQQGLPQGMLLWSMQLWPIYKHSQQCLFFLLYWRLILKNRLYRDLKTTIVIAFCNGNNFGSFWHIILILIMLFFATMFIKCYVMEVVMDGFETRSYFKDSYDPYHVQGFIFWSQ